MAEQLITQAKTVSGNPAAFTTHLAVPLDSCKVHFKPIQEGSGDPSPENVRNIVGWTGLEAYFNKLPSEYTPVEYLESTGTQYIITNLHVYKDTVCQGRVQKIEGAADQYPAFFCATTQASSNPGYVLHVNVNPLAGRAGQWSNSATANITTEVNNATYDIHEFEMGFNYIKIKDKTYTGSLTWNNDLSNAKMGLFCRVVNDSLMSSSRGSMRIYRLSFSSATESANFVPCLRNSDNKPGMYDTINNVFYTNNGTGEFKFGTALAREGRIISVTALGKNLINKSLLESGTFSGSGENVALSKRVRTPWIQVKEGITYTMSVESGKQVYAYQVKNDSGQILYHKDNALNDLSTTYTIPSGGTAIRIVYAWTDATASTEMPVSSVSSPQLELGDTATVYEQFATVYGGYVDLVSGEVVATQISVSDTWGNIKRTDAGYTDPNTNYQWGYLYFPYRVKEDGTNGNKAYCNVGKRYWNGNTETFPHFYIPTVSNNQYRMNVILHKDTDDNLICQGVATLYEPIILATLSPTQLISFIGSNYISSNTNDTIEVTYRDENRIAPGMLAIKERIAANEPHRETATGDIASFSTDMIAPLTSVKASFLPVQSGSGDPFPPIIESGGIVAANNVKEEPNAKTWEIHFEPKQAGSGTPSPSNVRAISGWTGVEGYQTGRNILNPFNNPIWNNSVYTINSDGSITCSGSDGRGWTNSQMTPLPLKKGTYTLSYSSGGNCNLTTNESNYETLITSTKGSLTFTLVNDGDIKFKFSNVTYPATFTVQIEVGPTATTYTPYSAPTTYSLDWTNEAGEIYGGYVDVVSGTLTVTHGIKTITSALKSGTWDSSTGKGAFWYVVDTTLNSDNDGVVCDTFEVADVIWNQSTANGFIWYANGIIRWIDLDHMEDSAADYSNYLASHPIHVTYKIKNPTTTYSLSPTSISLISGKNTFWSNATSVKVTTQGNVRPISGWTGTEVYRTGKNLIDPTISLSTQGNNPSSHGVVNADGTLTVKYRDQTGWTARGYIELPAGTYRFYSSFGSSYNSRYLINDKGTEISWNGYKTITITETTKFRFRPAMGTDYPITGYLQVLKANEEYDPNPYVGIKIPINWNETGTIYGGYVDLVKGELVQTYQYISLGNLTPVNYGASSYDGTLGTNAMYYITNTNLYYNAPSSKVFSDKFKWAGAGTWSNPNNFIWKYCLNAGEQLHVVFDNQTVGITSNMTFAQRRTTIKTWLQTNPAIFVLPLKTPIIHSLSPQQLKSLRGQNNIWSNLNGTTTATYWTH